MKRILDYSITDHGVEHHQYFQGDGISFTEYTDCATGCGNSAYDALDDAFEQLASNGWDTETIPNEMSDEVTTVEDDYYHYVTVKVR